MPRDGGENPLSASGLIALVRRADKDLASARCVAGTRDGERSGDLHEVDRRHAVHVLQIEIARKRLQRLVRQRRILPQERDADIMRTGFDRDLRAQAPVERFFRQREVRVRQLVVLIARPQLNVPEAVAIDEAGRVVARIDLDTVSYADLPLPAHTSASTLYSRGGDWILLGLLGLGLLPVALTASRKHNS